MTFLLHPGFGAPGFGAPDLEAHRRDVQLSGATLSFLPLNMNTAPEIVTAARGRTRERGSPFRHRSCVSPETLPSLLRSLGLEVMMISENRRSELRDRLAELNRARAKIEELAREHEISIGEARALMEMMGDDPAQLEATAETLRRLKRSTAI